MNNHAILVLSCDKYSDLWLPFFQNFFHQFDRIDCNVYLGSNEIDFNYPGVISIKSGKDANWSDSTSSILSKIEEDYIFVILEDLFPITTLDFTTVVKYIEYMQSNNIQYLRYWSLPLPDVPTAHSNVGYITPGAPYRVTVCGLWKRTAFMSLLLSGENPWQFEIFGSYRSSYLDGFCSVYVNLFEFINLIEKGRWITKSLNEISKYGIGINEKFRNKNSGYLKFVSNLKMIIFNLMQGLPWRLRLGITNFVRRILATY